MPKMKTHRGAAKRFKKTGSGKLIKIRPCLWKPLIRKQIYETKTSPT